MILVTGATGFVGRHVVQSLRSQGKEVKALVRRTSNLGLFQGLGVTCAYGDVADVPSVRAAMEGVDAVIHLVAIIRESKGATFEGVNHIGTRNVAVAAREAGVRRLLHMSAIGVANLPQFPYLAAKWQGEQEVLRSGVPQIVFRSSIIFGPGDEFINALAGVVRALPVMPVAGSGKALFQPIAVEEVARCVAQAVEREDLLDRVVYLGGPQHLTYEAIMDTIAATYGAKRLKVHVPLALMHPAVKVVGKLLPRFPVTSQQLELLKFDNVTELDAVESTFGFKPRPLAGSIDYIKRLSLGDAWRICLGAMPRHIRDH